MTGSSPWRLRLLWAVVAVVTLGLVTPLLGFGAGGRLVLGLPVAVIWVVLCLVAVFAVQLLVYRHDLHMTDSSDGQEG